jgi:hypothetical protein
MVITYNCDIYANFIQKFIIKSFLNIKLLLVKQSNDFLIFFN